MVTPILKKCPLFAGIADDQLKSMLDCLSAKRAVYEKEAFIFRADERARYVGVLLSGGVRVIQEDFWGNRVILTHIEPGGLFGEAFSCAEVDRLPVSVVAAEKSEVMLIDCRRIITTCTSACEFHTRMITNMLRILAEKNIMLTRKMEHLSRRTTREKLLSFLSSQAVSAQHGTVELPFNRQELADYLCVDRSALSRELAAMRRDGLLRYNRNRFVLLDDGN